MADQDKEDEPTIEQRLEALEQQLGENIRARSKLALMLDFYRSALDTANLRNAELQAELKLTTQPTA